VRKVSVKGKGFIITVYPKVFEKASFVMLFERA